MEPTAARCIARGGPGGHCSPLFSRNSLTNQTFPEMLLDYLRSFKSERHFTKESENSILKLFSYLNRFNLLTHNSTKTLKHIHMENKGGEYNAVSVNGA